MNIAILGAGAMGSLYGSYLSEDTQNKIYLIDINEQLVKTINDFGVIIKKNEKEIKFFPKAYINSKNLPTMDIIIVFVKSIFTDKAIEQNKNIIGKHTIVCTIQNGYGNIQKIREFVCIDNIIAGTTSNGCTTIKDGYLNYAGIGSTNIGWAYKKEDNRINKLKQILTKSGFETNILNNPEELILKKLIVNIGINAITAILNVSNGEILDNVYINNLMKNTVKEAIKVINALGFNFIEEEGIKLVEKVCRQTKLNKSSMLQDVLNKRKTEIETINGFIVLKGKKLNLNVNVNETLTNLVKSIEEKNLK